MIKWQSTSEIHPASFVTLPVDAQVSQAQWSVASASRGEQGYIEIALRQSHGNDGHMLGAVASASDLHVALNGRELAAHKFEIIQGREYLIAPSPLPEGAMS